MNQINYKIPIGISKKQEYKYLNIINIDHCCDILYCIKNVGGIVSLQQFYSIYALYEKNIKQSTLKTRCNKLLKILEENKFIGTDKINKYKFIFLKTPSYALVTGVYKNYSISNLKKINNKVFTRKLLEVEYFLKNNQFLNTMSFLYDLKYISNELFKISNSYQDELKNFILNSNELRKIQEEISKYNFKNDNLLKIIWFDLANIFNKLKMQSQYINGYETLHLYSTGNGIFLHYIPKMVIFDTFDKKYYINKINNLFSEFNRINNNETLKLKEKYLSNCLNQNSNRIGFTLEIISTNEREIKEKLKYISNGLDTINSPIINLDYDIYDISEYFSIGCISNVAFNEISNYIDRVLAKNEF